MGLVIAVDCGKLQLMDKNQNRSFSRGLRVLRLLSTVDGRSCNEVARGLGLPRATSHRLLKTLESEGYAALTPSDNRYRLTPEAQFLGKPDDWETWVTSVVAPRLNAFTKEHLWTVALSTLHGVQMMTRLTTDAMSPFSLDHYRSGYLMSLTRSSPGLVWLAFCEESLRLVLLKHIHSHEAVGDEPLSKEQLEYQLNQVRAQGYAFAPVHFSGEHAYAIPVFVKGQLHSALSIRYITKAKRPENILEETLLPLQAVASDLAQAIEQSSGTN